MIRWIIALTVFPAALPAAAGEAQPWDGLTFHHEARPADPGAKSEDWPRVLGPRNAPVSGETGIARDFPAGGPPLVWECRRGLGYAAPSVAGGRLVHFHRLDGKETIECLDAATGRLWWSHRYPVEYRDDFGYSEGPRSAPVISGNRVVTFGVTSRLKCLDLGSGKVIWERDCAKEDGVPQYFFGSGASPLIRDDLVICNLGGADNLCVAAFSLATGELKWKTVHEWGQSYASPVPVEVHGKSRVLVFAGGKSQPAVGGLLSIDPATGTAEDTFPWRARRYPSVNAATPVLCGDDQVFITQAYVDRDSPCNGGAMLKIGTDGKFTPVWKNAALGCHWMTPVYHDGHLYAFVGEKERQCELACHAAADGKQLWHKRIEWTHEAAGQTIPVGFMRGSLLKVEDRFLCLGEWGTLAWLKLSPEGGECTSRFQPFLAQQSWTLPVLSHGLLYVCQNDADTTGGTPTRLLCYDLRAAQP